NGPLQAQSSKLVGYVHGPADRVGTAVCTGEGGIRHESDHFKAQALEEGKDVAITMFRPQLNPPLGSQVVLQVVVATETEHQFGHGIRCKLAQWIAAQPKTGDRPFAGKNLILEEHFLYQQVEIVLAVA